MTDRRERGGYPRGDDSPLSLYLSLETLSAIRTAYARGVKGRGCAAVAARFGLTSATVHRIVNRSGRWSECHPLAEEAS